MNEIDLEIKALNRRIDFEIKKIESEKTWTCSRSSTIDLLYFLLELTNLLKVKL